MELFKGINQIKLPLSKAGLDSVNVYIIEGKDGNLMIDTGWNTPEAFNALAQEMKTSGFAMKDITNIVVTHLHPDHLGLAGKIAELSGASISVSEIENNLLDSRLHASRKPSQRDDTFLYGQRRAGLGTEDARGSLFQYTQLRLPVQGYYPPETRRYVSVWNRMTSR